MLNYKTWPVIFALLCLCFWAKAQTISGTVLYDDTGKPAVGATVYYSGSGIGTMADSLGHFELRALSKQIPINVSFIGYYTAVAQYDPPKAFIIRLKPKTEELKTVTIRADGMNRSYEEKLFFIGFIGTTEQALSCTIVNIKDVNLFYDTSTKTLSATSEKPIIVKNQSLGYTIYYYLDRYSSSPELTQCIGNSRFVEDPELAALSKTKRNREDVYEGSHMQFVRALWHNTLKKTGFNIYTLDYDKLTEDSVTLTDAMGLKDFKAHKTIFVNYKHNRNLFSRVHTNDDMVYIDKAGYNGVGLIFSGPFGRERLGNALPLDYASEVDKDYFPEFITEKNKAIADNKLAEAMMAQRVAAIKTIKDDSIKHTLLKEVKIKGQQTVVLRGGAILSPWGPDQVFDITPEDFKYKTLEWYLLQNAKGATQSPAVQSITGVVFAGIDTAKHIFPNFQDGAIRYQGTSVLMPPKIFVNGRELMMDEPTTAETYRFEYFNMPIARFKKIVLKHMVGTLHGLSAGGRALHTTAEQVLVDRYLLYLTTNDGEPLKRDTTTTVQMPGDTARTINGKGETITTPANFKTTQLKEVKIKGKQNVMLNNGTMLTGWGTDQVFNISFDDVKYKTLLNFLLQNTKGAETSSVLGVSGVVYIGVDTSSVRSVQMPPLLFVDGKELYMDEKVQAETYRDTYLNMPIGRFKTVVLKHMVGTLHGINIPATEETTRKVQLPNPIQEAKLVDRYLLYLTLKY